MPNTPKNRQNLSLLEYLRYEEGMLYWKRTTNLRIPVGSRAGTTNPHRGYRQIKLHGTVYQEHHLVWYLCKGEWPTSEMDHINGDKADNHIENLRLVTHAENLNYHYRRLNSVSQT